MLLSYARSLAVFSTIQVFSFSPFLTFFPGMLSVALIMRVVIVVFFQFDDGIHTSLLSSCPFASPIRTSPNTFVCSDFSFFSPQRIVMGHVMFSSY